MEKESFLLDFILKEKEFPSFIQNVTYKYTGEILSIQKNKESRLPETNLYSIFDIPDYFELQVFSNSSLKVFKSPLYYGYYINLLNYKDFEDFLRRKVRNARYSQLRRYKKRLEKCLNPKYNIYFGSIDKKEYDFLFDVMIGMIEKRFLEKEEYNYELPFFDLYKSAIYPLILKKKAAIFTIYSNDKPICITLNLIFDKTVLHWNSAYDIDYSMFNLGHINTYNHLEWSFSNGYAHFDMGRGDFFHKRKWVDNRYRYEQLIYSVSGNLFQIVQAAFYSGYISLRFHAINQIKKLKIHLAISKVYKSLYRLKNLNSSNPKSRKIKILEEGRLFSANETFIKSSIDDFQENQLLKEYNYFLHQNQENISHVEVYRKKNNEETIVVFRGENKYRIIGVPE